MPESPPSSKRAKLDDAPDARAVEASPSAMRASRRVAATLPRYLTFFEYDGSALHGFQRQSDATVRTVQGALDDALTRFTGSRGPVTCVGSSRTDAGVHATRNSAHFDVGRAGAVAAARTADPRAMALSAAGTACVTGGVCFLFQPGSASC